MSVVRDLVEIAKGESETGEMLKKEKKGITDLCADHFVIKKNHLRSVAQRPLLISFRFPSTSLNAARAQHFHFF